MNWALCSSFGHSSLPLRMCQSQVGLAAKVNARYDWTDCYSHPIAQDFLFGLICSLQKLKTRNEGDPISPLLEALSDLDPFYDNEN